MNLPAKSPADLLDQSSDRSASELLVPVEPAETSLTTAAALTHTRHEREVRILNGPVRGAVFWLALPTLGEQALNACVSWSDTILAGRISAIATGAVGFSGYVGWFMTMMFALVGIGATAVVSRAIGASRRDEANHAANQAFLLAIGIGLAASTFVYAAAPGLARIMNMSGQAFQIAVTYLRIDSLGMVPAAVSFALAACLRGTGDTRTPMFLLGGVNIVNIIVSWTLTFGIASFPGIGVNGIAIGTAVARWIGAIWICSLLMRGRRILQLRPAAMRADRSMIGRMVRVGGPASLDGGLTFLGHFVFMSIISRLPTAFPTAVVYAAHVVGIRIEAFSYLPANAYMQAAATMVGQNLGADQPERARRATNEAVRQVLLILLGSGTVYLLAGPMLFRLFSDDPRVAEVGLPALRGLAIFQLTLAPLIVYLGALRGAGDTRIPMLFTIFGMGLVRLPVALFGGFVLKWGLLGAWLGMFSDLTVRALLVSWRFKSGRWKRMTV